MAVTEDVKALAKAVNDALTGVAKVLADAQAEAKALAAQVVSSNAELASIHPQLEPMRKEMAGQAAAMLKTYADATAAGVKKDQAEAALAASLATIEKTIAAATKRADAAYADRVAEKEADLAALQKKIDAETSRYHEFKKSLA